VPTFPILTVGRTSQESQAFCNDYVEAEGVYGCLFICLFVVLTLGRLFSAG
jgi:hypothetical protein